MDGTYVGIDVSKDSLSVAVFGREEVVTVANSDEGLARLCSLLRSWKPALVVLEATGGYERLAVGEIAAAGLPVVLANPRQVRDFAKALGKLAKTDAIDAGVIAHFAQAVKPPVRPLPTADAREMADLISHRRHLVGVRAAQQNRLAQATSKRIAKDIRTLMVLLDKQIKAVEDRVDVLIDRSPELKATFEIIDSVPGCGEATARTLVVELPELGRASRQEIAALTGLAPMNADSGTHRGRRRIRGGRSAVRTALYMATMSAISCNAAIRPYYAKLVAGGKRKIVALVACMRKLLVMINAMVRTGTHWKSTPATP